MCNLKCVSQKNTWSLSHFLLSHSRRSIKVQRWHWKMCAKQHIINHRKQTNENRFPFHDWGPVILIEDQIWILICWKDRKLVKPCILFGNKMIKYVIIAFPSCLKNYSRLFQEVVSNRCTTKLSFRKLSKQTEFMKAKKKNKKNRKFENWKQGVRQMIFFSAKVINRSVQIFTPNKILLTPFSNETCGHQMSFVSFK